MTTGSATGHLRFGNLTVAEFAARVGAQFTTQEIETLESRRSDYASFTDKSAFHIFDDPSIAVHLGQDAHDLVPIFVRANDRSTFTREVGFYDHTPSR